MPDALRLAIGTLTRFPVPAPGRVDRRTAAGAMLLAPVVGALMALIVGLAAQALRDHASVAAPSALLAALAIAALAYLDRGLHLDGLADTADALGSGRPPDEALAIARRSDIGPFGVATIVLVLLIQVLAYAGLVDGGHAAFTLVVAVGTSRLALVLACLRGVPAARGDGLGAAVAGSVPVWASVLTILAWIAACCGAAAWLAPDLVTATLTSVVGALVVATGVLAVSIRRLGGITGDVLGASIELALSTALVILVAVPA